MDQAQIKAKANEIEAEINRAQNALRWWRRQQLALQGECTHPDLDVKHGYGVTYRYCYDCKLDEAR